MQRYVLRRLLASVPVVFMITLVIFGLIRLLPGDVIMAKIAEAGPLRQEDIAWLRAELGLDKPFHEQYLTWISGALRGDLGTSYWNHKPVMENILIRLPVTMELAILSLIIAAAIALPLGVISAARSDSGLDYLARLFSISGLSIPEFWIATMAIVFPAIWWHYLPPLNYVSPFDNLGANLRMFLPPTLILGYRLSAVTMRMTRSTMLEVLRQDYIRTAWAKGLRERVVIYRHALKNAMIPVVTIFGTQLGALMGGTVIIETVFNIAGVGRLTLDSILVRDYMQIQGNVLFFAIWVAAMNLFVDITYTWLDPRIRYQ